MQVIFIGGSMDGRQQELPDGYTTFDVDEGQARVQYCKRIWVYYPDEHGDQRREKVFFVLHLLGKDQATEMILKHFSDHGFS